MTTDTPTLSPAQVADYAIEMEFRATPQDVWQALTDDIGRWWPSTFYMCTGPGQRKFSLDARPGGLVLEEHGAGNGMVWGNVIHVQKHKILEVTGSYGRPLTWLGKYELTAIEGGTRLRFTESMFGRVTEQELASKDHGWRYLYDGCMRAHLEGTEQPAWPGDPTGNCG